MQLSLIAEKVYLIQEAIRHEDQEKLQEWTARQRQIDPVQWPKSEART